MRIIGDLARGGHQAHIFEQYNISELRNPWYLRMAWWLKDFFCPRKPLEGYGLIIPGQTIQKIGTGYHDPTLPGYPTRATRRDSGRSVYYA